MAELTGKQVQARTRNAINNRFRPRKRAGATKAQLHETLEKSTAPEMVRYALEQAGLEIETASADELFDVLYALSWADQFKRRAIREYFETQWGEDIGTLMLAA